MRHDMVVIGLGGFGREVLDVIDAINADVGRADRLNVVGILDDAAPAPSALELYDLDYLGATAELERLPESVGYIAGSTQVYKNGILLGRDVDYTESDPVAGRITFTTSPAGATLWVVVRTT